MLKVLYKISQLAETATSKFYNLSSKLNFYFSWALHLTLQKKKLMLLPFTKYVCTITVDDVLPAHFAIHYLLCSLCGIKNHLISNMKDAKFT